MQEIAQALAFLKKAKFCYTKSKFALSLQYHSDPFFAKRKGVASYPNC